MRARNSKAAPAGVRPKGVWSQELPPWPRQRPRATKTPVPIAVYNEAQVQHELYHQARLLGLEVIPEYVIKLWGGRIRADLAFVDHQGRLCLVEVKKNKSFRPRVTNQKARYDSTGLPWRYCEGMEDILSTLMWVQMTQALSS